MLVVRVMCCYQYQVLKILDLIVAVVVVVVDLVLKISLNWCNNCAKIGILEI